MRPETNAVSVSERFQDPDLLLLQGLPICVYLEAEGLGGEVLELGVDEADGPAALLWGWRRGSLPITIHSHRWNCKKKIILCSSELLDN